MNSRITLYYNHAGAMADALKPRARLIVDKTAKDVIDISKLSMSGPKTGLWYRSSKTGHMHHASAPGEPPARDIGQLANAHKSTMDPTEPKATIRVTTDYAETLEFGGAHVAARPYMRPALEKVKPSFVKALDVLFAVPGGKG